MKSTRQQRHAGAGYIDVIVGIGLMTVVFLGIFGVLRLSVEVIGNNKAKVGAIALANEQMEFIRSLSYNDVGVTGGIPSGAIASTTIETINNIEYTRRTDVRYVDAAADGLGIDDDNSIQNDYKVAKVEVEWNLRGEPKSITLVSNIVPRGIETGIPGTGVLSINVINSLGLPLSGATVDIVNTSVAPPITISTLSNANGIASFPGAPTSTSAYEITVSNTNYSTAQTYAATTALPNPTPGHLTVVEDAITSSTFAIDILGTMNVTTYRATTSGALIDTLDDTSYVAATSNTVVYSGELELGESSPGFYHVSGTMSSDYVYTPDLIAWDTLSWTEDEPAPTDLVMQVYYSTGSVRTIVPDSDLPGNAGGFAAGPIDLSGLDPDIYWRLSVEATLSTGNVTFTPELRDWTISYVYGPVPDPNVGFDIVGAKTIGTDGGGIPVPKYSTSFTTSATGSYALSDMEWDTYTFTFNPAYDVDIVRNCPLTPYGLEAGASTTVEFIVATSTAHSLLVSVIDGATGDAINDATIRLYQNTSAYDETDSTTRCGQMFWGGLSTGTVSGGDPYSLDVSAVGYTDEQLVDEVDVDGDSVVIVTMS